MPSPRYWEKLERVERKEIQTKCVLILHKDHPSCDENRSPPKESVIKRFLEQTVDLDDPEWFKKDRAIVTIRSNWRRLYTEIILTPQEELITKVSEKIGEIKRLSDPLPEKKGDTNIRVSWDTHAKINSIGRRGESMEEILKRMIKICEPILTFRNDPQHLDLDMTITFKLKRI